MFISVFSTLKSWRILHFHFRCIFTVVQCNLSHSSCTWYRFTCSSNAHRQCLTEVNESFCQYGVVGPRITHLRCWKVVAKICLTRKLWGPPPKRVWTQVVWLTDRCYKITFIWLQWVRIQRNMRPSRRRRWRPIFQEGFLAYSRHESCINFMCVLLFRDEDWHLISVEFSGAWVLCWQCCQLE